MQGWADVIERNAASPRTARRLVGQLRACEAAAIAFRGPLFLGQGPGEFGRVLLDEDEPAVVDVREELADRRATRRRPEIPHGLREGPKQVDEDGVVPVPGVQQSFEQASIRCFHIFRSMLRRLD